MKNLCLLIFVVIGCSSRNPGEIQRVNECYKTINLPTTSFQVSVPETWDTDFEISRTETGKVYSLERLLSSIYVNNIRGEKKLSSGSIIITDVSPQKYLSTLKKNLQVFPRVQMTTKERLKIISQVPSDINDSFDIVIEKGNVFYKFRYFIIYDSSTKRTIIIIINSFTKSSVSDSLARRVFDSMKKSLKQ